MALIVGTVELNLLDSVELRRIAGDLGITGDALEELAGTALWATALLLVSIPRVLPTIARVLGVASAILFAIVARRIFWGEQLLPTSAPLPFYAHPFLVMTLISWIWSLLHEGAP